MRELMIVVAAVVVLAGCDICSPGEMRCQGSKAQMCDTEKAWETYQDCGSIGESCSTSPAQCSGYTQIACCY